MTDDRQHHRWGTADDRGQSTTLDYTLSLAVATLVLTALFTTAGDFVTDQRQDVIRTELSVIGQHVASEVTAADRLVQSGDADRLVANRSLPDRATGSSYSIDIADAPGGPQLRQVTLSTENPEVSVTVRFRTATDLVETAVQGGDVTVVYDPGSDELEVQS
jgi:hypothetical protein